MKRLRKLIKISAIVLLLLIALLSIVTLIYMRLPQFGKAPEGQRLTRIERAANYRNGHFENLEATPTFAPGYSFSGEMRKALFATYPGRYPEKDIPAIKTDLQQLPKDTDAVIWFGHSSCYIQLEGKRILIDPIFSQHASPVPGTVKPFSGTDIYSAADFPEIDYLLISHDHYDHLDYETILALKDKTKQVICGLGVGAHFERWGYPADKVIELAWYESAPQAADGSVKITATPARHQSGRGFSQNNTLWMSFVIQTAQRKIYVSGDSGYGRHFKEIGKAYGPMDLAIIENGQYDSAWHYVHCLPGEVLQAAQDLGAARLLPVHSSKFVLARHRWDEPLKEITRLDQKVGIPLVTPEIGEVVYLDDKEKVFRQWWKDK
ncbi:MBL fold metallo-hydrolase [Chitinophaga pinensis]|uniref:Metallo-beta-lactamase domain-containing protein n=1 Tax=Chitinophaga pinensis (strain ATCC 43595 / DSM 2588 / LMG 13176 / NBRC 15968 / NCIMB 11800 / UQM 2034) TaxID=485918 RepID=A0A979G8Z0_CHIPD|nr:MBL fold metallo-hydrolase [Chitinophaga pinensis]ACU63149.1 conserved hypothetical protein [Chitinophaga pinensis DSM 2588]